MFGRRITTYTVIIHSVYIHGLDQPSYVTRLNLCIAEM
jgi:hypothetical protein